jgi:two-component system, NarL family, invasion response regulator UvrY
MKNILVVEDHPVMSAGTSLMIRNCLPEAKIIEVDTFWKAIQVADTTQLDLVIMDIGIPGGDSVQMVEKFKIRWPNLRLLMFSAYEESVYALSFIQAGANGFLSKKATESEFRLAVETVLLQNRVYVSNEIRDLSLNMFMKNRTAPTNVLSTLSIREREIIQLFIARKGTSEVAAILNLSTSTVNTYKVRIFKKMGVDNLIDLVRKYELLSPNSKN